MSDRSQLAAALKASLLGTANAFNDDDFVRHLDAAVADFSRFIPQVFVATVNVIAGTACYPCPDDLVSVLGNDWGRNEKNQWQPWDDRHPGRLPDIRVTKLNGQRALFFIPAPTGRQIDLLGNPVQYRYAAAHVLDDNGTTLLPEHESLVLLRAQAEAMRELAAKHTTTPYQVRDGISSTPRNGTPSYLFTVLINEFTERVRQ